MTDIYMYIIYIHLYISWSAVVKGNLKAAFSIATTPRSIPYNVEC